MISLLLNYYKHSLRKLNRAQTKKMASNLEERNLMEMEMEMEMALKFEKDAPIQVREDKLYIIFADISGSTYSFHENMKAIVKRLWDSNVRKIAIVFDQGVRMLNHPSEMRIGGCTDIGKAFDKLSELLIAHDESEYVVYFLTDGYHNATPDKEYHRAIGRLMSIIKSHHEKEKYVSFNAITVGDYADKPLVSGICTLLNTMYSTSVKTSITDIDVFTLSNQLSHLPVQNPNETILTLSKFKAYLPSDEWVKLLFPMVDKIVEPIEREEEAAEIELLKRVVLLPESPTFPESSCACVISEKCLKTLAFYLNTLGSQQEPVEVLPIGQKESVRLRNLFNTGQKQKPVAAPVDSISLIKKAIANSELGRQTQVTEEEWEQIKSNNFELVTMRLFNVLILDNDDTIMPPMSIPVAIEWFKLNKGSLMVVASNDYPPDLVCVRQFLYREAQRLVMDMGNTEQNILYHSVLIQRILVIDQPTGLVAMRSFAESYCENWVSVWEIQREINALNRIFPVIQGNPQEDTNHNKKHFLLLCLSLFRSEIIGPNRDVVQDTYAILSMIIRFSIDVKDSSFDFLMRSKFNIDRFCLLLLMVSVTKGMTKTYAANYNVNVNTKLINSFWKVCQTGNSYYPTANSEFEKELIDPNQEIEKILSIFEEKMKTNKSISYAILFLNKITSHFDVANYIKIFLSGFERKTRDNSPYARILYNMFAKSLEFLPNTVAIGLLNYLNCIQDNLDKRAKCYKDIELTVLWAGLYGTTFASLGIVPSQPLANYADGHFSGLSQDMKRWAVLNNKPELAPITEILDYDFTPILMMLSRYSKTHVNCVFHQPFATADVCIACSCSMFSRAKLIEENGEKKIELLTFLFDGRITQHFPAATYTDPRKCRGRYLTLLFLLNSAVSANRKMDRYTLTLLSGYRVYEFFKNSGITDELEHLLKIASFESLSLLTREEWDLSSHIVKVEFDCRIKVFMENYISKRETVENQYPKLCLLLAEIALFFE
jgi:hypothetical protein